eukprot:COSAG01_NODE_781_length_13657_cov_12.763239_4_plen_130_part_00
MGWRRGLPLNRVPRRALGRPQPTPGKTMRGVALLLISLLMVLVPRAASAQEPPKPDVVKHAELTLKDIKVSAKSLLYSIIGEYVVPLAHVRTLSEGNRRRLLCCRLAWQTLRDLERIWPQMAWWMCTIY